MSTINAAFLAGLTYAVKKAEWSPEANGALLGSLAGAGVGAGSAALLRNFIRKHINLPPGQDSTAEYLKDIGLGAAFGGVAGGVDSGSGSFDHAGESRHGVFPPGTGH